MDLSVNDANRLALAAQRGESNLRDSVLPFWTRNTWDKEYGGFLTRLDRRGNLLDKSEKILMMQVRMLWSLSAAYSYGITDKGYLDLASQAFDYIIQTMWDEREGGFFYSVERRGALLCMRKNTDSHGYALTAISQYYIASGRKKALEWAQRIFELLMEKAKDGNLGFFEEFDGKEWPVLNGEQMDLGDNRNIKTIDMHVNVMEGLLYLCRASNDALHKRALRDILTLIVERGINPAYGGTFTAFDYKWNPVADVHGAMTTSYGLNVEAAWLLAEALDILEIPRETYKKRILGLIDHAINFGIDEIRGGIAAYGPATGRAAESGLPSRCLLKAWWEQAEALNAFITAFEWTGDQKYLDAFLKTFDWCWNYQIDHECGDWYQNIDPAACVPVTKDKGGEFKTAFHVSRMLMRICEIIRRIIG